jgi:TRAP transporter 4TM/12TM fusion protein
MLAKFDHLMTGIGRWLALLLALAAIYVAGPFPLVDEGLRLGGAMAVGVVIMLLHHPLAHKFKHASTGVKSLLWLVDMALLVGFLFTVNNFFATYEGFWDGIFVLSISAQLTGLFGTLVILEAVRRTFGPILPIICGLALIYTIYGGGLPGILGHSGFSFEETITAVWFSFDGVYGRVTGLVSSIVLVFITFGAVLEATGASAILLKIATAATARVRGGTAHAAIVASALFGTISGSPVANVVGTGVFTIPMIKRQGFSNAFAGAVEAGASSAGQFTPPIMGAVAFIMAELIGQPYYMVAVAAALPALLFYFAMFASVYAEAVRLGIKPMPKDERPHLTRDDAIESLRFVVPLIAVVVVLFLGRSPAMAGFFGVVTGVVISLVIDVLDPAKRASLATYPTRFLAALKRGGAACGQIMVAVGSIGIVIAAVKLTGVAGNFGAMVQAMAEGSLFTALVVTMIACLVLGLGLPTVPAYLFIVLFVGPVIGNLGVDILLVHLFVVYYGVLSNITPPVAIAAYAAAPIAGSNPMETGFQAIKIAFVGFLIPFVLIYNPSLSLIVGFEWTAFIWIMVRLPVAVWLIATAFIGCDSRQLSALERIGRTLIGLACLLEIELVQVAGFGIGLGIILLHRLRRRAVEPATASGNGFKSYLKP